ncbi:outer dynein arm-docking complex subunit 2 isoform X3 [Nematostella vectensis]|uniref:outer dynein arm-docking complex subunit 2 isoform X3 n=1 Tax=Nematostella vectensis TaxID=45351 RepID=UPI0020773DB6|nr:outer dynein arm-docking complex subunit 2 isoform X3 [Nematostella vectensis]
MDHHGEDGYTDDFASEESERKENDDQSEAEFEKNEEEGEENTKSHEEHQQRTSPEGLPPAERQPDRGKKTKPKATSIRKPAKRKEREKHKEEQANDSNWKQEKGKDKEKKQEKIGKLVKGEKSKKQKRGEREDHGKTSKDNRKSTSPKEPRKTQNESKHQRESSDAKSTANKKESQTGSRNEEQSPKTNPRPPRRRARNVPKMSGRVVSGNSAHWYSSESSSSSEESEDDDIIRKIRPELTTEYWEIHRLVKYLRAGNPTVTIIALCALQDFSIEQEGCQLSLLDLRAAPVLLNLLNTDNYSCVIGSLQLLRRLSCSKFVNLELYRLGGVEQLVSCLESSSFEVQSLAAATLANLVTFGKAYSAVRKGKGIRKLVELLKPGDTKSVKVHTRSYTNDHDHSTLRRNACNALWSCTANMTYSFQQLESSKSALTTLIPQTVFRGELRKNGMIQEIVQLLIDGSEDMKALCASAIDKCAEDEETRELVLKHGGLDPMVDVLATRPCKNAELLAAIAGALWKCAEHGDSMRRLERLGTVNHLITQVKLEHSLPVMSNLIGALGQFAYCKRNILTIHEEKVLDILIQKLNLTEPSILINSNALLARCAKENALRSHILSSDGLRLLWSHLKFSNPKVVASAADAISMCAVKPEESAEMIRSFVGGLELVTALLKSNRREILLGVCRLIINIGQDRENMSIMTDYGVIPLLVTLIDTPDDEEMRRYVAEAIATCCNLDKNIPALSSTVVPLTDGLSTFKSVEVHKATALALEKLSQDSRNCALICKHGARKHLMIMMASSDETVQNAAARCIKNVRMNTVNANS